MPSSDAIDKDRTMCPIKTVGKPKIWMSHTCVDVTFLPSGKLIVSGRVAMHVRMSDCWLQGIQPCKCKGEGHSWIGNQVFR